MRQVETTASLWYMRGLAVIARFGTVQLIGCRRCVRRGARRAALATLGLGWWSVPWGVATPIVVLQNLLVRDHPRDLPRALAAVGVLYEDVVIDQNGMSGEQRRLLWAYAHVAARLALAGDAPRVERTAGELLSELTRGRVTTSSARAAVQDGLRYALPLPRLDAEDRLGLLAFAFRLAEATGLLAGTASSMGFQLAAELGIPAAIVEAIFVGEPSAGAAELDAARRVLGVGSDASSAEVRQRYRALLVRFHPDKAVLNGISVDEATRRTQEITAAYRVLMAELGHASI